MNQLDGIVNIALDVDDGIVSTNDNLMENKNSIMKFNQQSFLKEMSYIKRERRSCKSNYGLFFIHNKKKSQFTHKQF